MFGLLVGGKWGSLIVPDNRALLVSDIVQWGEQVGVSIGGHRGAVLVLKFGLQWVEECLQFTLMLGGSIAMIKLFAGCVEMAFQNSFFRLLGACFGCCGRGIVRFTTSEPCSGS